MKSSEKSEARKFQKDAAYHAKRAMIARDNGQFEEWQRHSWAARFYSAGAREVMNLERVPWFRRVTGREE